MLSKACQYAVKASIYIAQQSLKDRKVNIGEIATAIEAPEAFTAKILQQLTKPGLLSSQRGKLGGFFFPKEKLNEVFIYDIIVLIDGDSLFTECGLGLKECSEINPCPVHDTFKEIRAGIWKMGQKYSLLRLAEGTQSGLFRLKV